MRVHKKKRIAVILWLVFNYIWFLTDDRNLELKTQGDNGYNPIKQDTLAKYYELKEYQEFMGRNLEFWERKIQNK